MCYFLDPLFYIMVNTDSLGYFFLVAEKKIPDFMRLWGNI